MPPRRIASKYQNDKRYKIVKSDDLYYKCRVPKMGDVLFLQEDLAGFAPFHVQVEWKRPSEPIPIVRLMGRFGLIAEDEDVFDGVLIRPNSCTEEREPTGYEHYAHLLALGEAVFNRVFVAQ